MLDGINVHIRPGEVVGLVGLSGAGKTTFASLLPRFYDVSSGTLRVAAARAAAADGFIMGMPDGYQTMLGDGGSGLSGGQRQRIAIARAFLKDAPILILDEATASLDAESEALIQQELDRLVEGRTALIVAHRFSSIRVATRILVFESGRIVGDGSHAELYASCPLYRELYDRQSL